MASSNSQMIDKLLSVAYSEVEGGKKSGQKELAFIAGVFDFLNRQSSYLSDKKVANQLIKLTNSTIDDSLKKNEAINKKNKKSKVKKKKSKDPNKEDKIYTKALKSRDLDKEKEDKVALKKKINSSKDKNVKKDKYKATTKDKKAKSKKKKAKQEKTGNYQNDAANDIPLDTDDTKESSQEVIERLNELYSSFKFNYKKDYKVLIKLLGKRPSARIANSYLLELCKIIRMYAPNVLLNQEATMPIRGCDRAFRLSSNYEGRVYISDFEFAYELNVDKKNDKFLNADMYSNHPVCRHDASSVYLDHKHNIFFNELASFKNEALMILVPNKPAPKRVIQYKPIGDRCVCVDSYCFAKASELPPDYSLVLIKNGSKYISINTVPHSAGGKTKLKQKEYTKFDKKLPDAEFLCLNKRHDAVYILTTDLENYTIRLSVVLLNKSTKKESKVIMIKQWEDYDFEDLGYPGSGWWPKAISMCYMRDTNHAIVAIQKHLFIIGENPNKKWDYYHYYLGYSQCLCYDIAQNPKKRNSIIAVDGVIKHCKLYTIDIL